LFVNHTHASIFYSQAANFLIYLINTPSPDKTPYQSCYFFYVFFWYSPYFNFVTGNYWLRKLYIKFNEQYFVCKCSNVSTLNLNILPSFYKICIQSWSKLQELIQLCNNDIDSILKTRIFCNSSITFKNKPLVFTSFLQSNLRTINDIWDSNNTKSCHDIYNLLIDRRNCISEFSKIKKEYFV
jgi:hypothetical protein